MTKKRATQRRTPPDRRRSPDGEQEAKRLKILAVYRRRWVEMRPTPTVRELAELLGVSSTYAHHLTAELIDDGRLVDAGPNRGAMLPPSKLALAIRGEGDFKLVRAAIDRLDVEASMGRSQLRRDAARAIKEHTMLDRDLLPDEVDP